MSDPYDAVDLFEKQIRACPDADSRKALFWIWAQDMTFCRGQLSRSLVNLGYDDGDFSKPPKPPDEPTA